MYTIFTYAAMNVDPLRYQYPGTGFVIQSRRFSALTSNHAIKPTSSTTSNIQSKTQPKPEPYVSVGLQNSKSARTSTTSNIAQIPPPSERLESAATVVGGRRLPKKYKPAARRYDGPRCEIGDLEAN